MYDGSHKPYFIKQKLTDVAEAALTHFRSMDELLHGSTKGRTFIKRNAAQTAKSEAKATAKSKASSVIRTTTVTLVAASIVPGAQGESAIMATVSVDAALIAVPPDLMCAVTTAILGVVIALLIWWFATRRQAKAEEQPTASHRSTQTESPVSESWRGAEPVQTGTEAEQRELGNRRFRE